MSHTTEIKGIVFTDIDALKLAVQELKTKGVKCDLVENAKPRAYYDNQQGLGVAPHMLRLHDCRFDVGFYPNPDGQGFVARTDFWGGHVANVLGATAGKGEDAQQAQMGKLFHTYAVHATIRQAARRGQSVHRVNRPDGTVALTISVMG